jgi:hypothetical protein
MQIIDLLDPSCGSEMVASGGADLVDLRDLWQQTMLTSDRGTNGSKGGTVEPPFLRPPISPHLRQKPKIGSERSGHQGPQA